MGMDHLRARKCRLSTSSPRASALLCASALDFLFAPARAALPNPPAKLRTPMSTPAYCNVALPVPLRTLFTYSIPDSPPRNHPPRHPRPSPLPEKIANRCSHRPHHDTSSSHKNPRHHQIHRPHSRPHTKTHRARPMDRQLLPRPRRRSLPRHAPASHRNPHATPDRHHHRWTRRRRKPQRRRTHARPLQPTKSLSSPSWPQQKIRSLFRRRKIQNRRRHNRSPPQTKPDRNP